MAKWARSFHRLIRTARGPDEKEETRGFTSEPQMGVALLTRQRPPSMDNTEIAREKGRLAQELGIKETEVCILQESPLRILRAASKGRLDEFKRLYEADVNRLTLMDTKGRAAAHHAAKKNQTAILDFIHQHGGDIDSPDKDGNTPLMLAICEGHIEALQVLISCGADCNRADARGRIPLMIATEHKNDKAVTTLLTMGRVDVNSTSPSNKATALHTAAYVNSAACAQVLLDNGARMCQPCEIGYMPIHVAAKSASHEALQVLLAHAAKLGCTDQADLMRMKDNSKNMPLHSSIYSGDIQAVEACLTAGASILDEQDDRSNAVHMACAQGSLPIVELMFNRQPDVVLNAMASTDGCGMTPLHKAALFDRVAIVAYLLDKGADINAVDQESRTPVLLATSRNAWQTVSLLLTRGADTLVKDKQNRNVLHLSICNGGRPEYVKLFFDKTGMDQLMNEQDERGCTPMHYASEQGQIQTLEALIRQGANLNSKNNNRESPLHFAARHGRLQTCRRLLHSTGGQTCLNECDKGGNSPLHLAASEGHTRVVQLLLDEGATILKNKQGNTVLHLACVNGNVDSMGAILNVHANLLNCPNKKEETPLHVASRNGNALAVTFLLDKGAAIFFDDSQLHFVDVAIKHEHRDVLAAIVSNDRWSECFHTSSELFGCPMTGLIQHAPEICEMLLDRCRTVSKHDRKSKDFCLMVRPSACEDCILMSEATVTLAAHPEPSEREVPIKRGSVKVTYDFSFLQISAALRNRLHQEGKQAAPLFALNCMVRFNRINCLSHPVVTTYLRMKWRAYGIWFSFINLFIYVLFLAALTAFVKTYDISAALHYSPNCSYSNLSTAHPCQTYKQPLSTLQMICLIVVALFAGFNILKEFGQMYQQKLAYITDLTNLLEWALYMNSLLFAAPFLFDIHDTWQWQCGAMSIFLGWFNFLLILQSFDFYGIYVVMFLEILGTLVQALLVFSILFIAFALAFFIIFSGEDSPYRDPVVSLISSLVMMTGNVEYMGNWIEPTYDEDTRSLRFPVLAYVALLLFLILMPILLMNLLIGLAVGDISAVQKNARLKRLAMQVQLHTDLEQKLPKKLLDFVDKPQWQLFPNKCTHRVGHMWGRMMKLNATPDETDVRNVSGQTDEYLYSELFAQKQKIKQVSATLDKTYSLVRLLVQKMEIKTEADEWDDPDPPVETEKSWCKPAVKHVVMAQSALRLWRSQPK